MNNTIILFSLLTSKQFLNILLKVFNLFFVNTFQYFSFKFFYKMYRYLLYVKEKVLKLNECKEKIK